MKLKNILFIAALTATLTPINAQVKNNLAVEKTGKTENVEKAYDVNEVQTTSDNKSIFFISYDISKLKNSESDSSVDMNGISAGFINSYGLRQYNSLYIDWGLGFTFGRYTEKDSSYYDKYQFSFWTMNMPLGLSYRVNLSEKCCLVPKAGLNFRLGLAANEVITTNEKHTFGSNTWYTEDKDRLDYFSKDDLGDDKWNMFMAGYNIGVNLEIDKVVLGVNYNGNFNELTENLKYQNFSIVLGFIF